MPPCIHPTSSPFASSPGALLHIYPLRPPLTLAKWSVSFQEHRSARPLPPYPPLHRPFVFDNWNDSRDIHECTPGWKASTANKWPSCELSVVTVFLLPTRPSLSFCSLVLLMFLLSSFFLSSPFNRSSSATFKRVKRTFNGNFFTSLILLPSFFFFIDNSKDFSLALAITIPLLVG